MRARSMQFKYLVIIITAILAIAVFAGGFAIYEVDNYIQENTKEFISVRCSNEATKMNDIFGDIEKSVRIMESYVLSLCDNAEDIKNRDDQNEVLTLAGSMFIDVATNTDGAIAYYLRLNPEISDSKAGIFYTKMNGGDEYVCLEPTDLSIYEKDDIEHVGWFWIPYEATRPIWMAPYYNQNNGIFMISYVIPLYFEGEFIGVVGMDFDYTVLTDRIHEIKIYDHGYAHLALGDLVVHSGGEIYDDGQKKADPEEYMQVSEKLTNGMDLVLFANYDDIRQIRYEIAYKILLSVLLLTVIFSLITFFMIKKAVNPLKRLTEASIRMSQGDYNVDIVHGKTYEIQQLSKAFETMLVNLREHERMQHLLAYRDPLTNLRNTTSYKKWVINFDEKIKKHESSFGVLMLDLNYLKEANDTYGHNIGDKLIVAASKIISETFKRSPVFRIGGDEFVVILQNRDLEARNTLFEMLDASCASTSVDGDTGSVKVSIAKGFSLYNPDVDRQFEDVFKRADEEMYNNKKIMKKAKI